jgi:hypothetical protein
MSDGGCPALLIPTQLLTMNHPKVRMRIIAILAGLFLPALLSAGGFSIRLDTVGFSSHYSSHNHHGHSSHVRGHSSYGQTGHVSHRDHRDHHGYSTHTTIRRHYAPSQHHHHHAPTVIFAPPSSPACAPVYTPPVRCYTPPVSCYTPQPVYSCPPRRSSIIYYRY